MINDFREGQNGGWFHPNPRALILKVLKLFWHSLLLLILDKVRKTGQLGSISAHVFLWVWSKCATDLEMGVLSVAEQLAGWQHAYNYFWSSSLTVRKKDKSFTTHTEVQSFSRMSLSSWEACEVSNCYQVGMMKFSLGKELTWIYFCLLQWKIVRPIKHIFLGIVTTS